MQDAQVRQTTPQHQPQQSPMSAVYSRPPTASGLMEPQPRRMQSQMLDGQGLGIGDMSGQVQTDDILSSMTRPVLLSRRSSYSQHQADNLSNPDLAGDVASKLSLLDGIVSAANSAREALLRGEDGAAHDKLGDLGNQLEIVGELGVGPAFSAIRSGDCTPAPPTPVFHSPGVISSIPSSGTNSAPPTLLPSLIPQDVPRTGAKRAAPPSPIDATIPAASKYMRVDQSNEFLSVPGTGTNTPNGHPTPPPLVHSHSFPNGHQLPSQAHTTNSIAVVPSTPPSFVAASGVQQHAPHVPSPLASHTISRPPSPPQFLSSNAQLDWSTQGIQQQPVVLPMPTPMQLQMQFQQQQQQLQKQHQQQLADHDAQFQAAQAQAQAHQASAAMDNEVPSMSRSGSMGDVRADGLPVVRARSSSVGKSMDMRGMTSMAPMETSAPPSAWRGFRQASPHFEEGEEEDESADEGDASDTGNNGQHRSKRRRSSVGHDVGEIINPHGGQLSEEVKNQLDTIFHDFMNRVCSDLDIRDSKGEKLHQVLMPKKMQRLDESPDFRPFKFRIQAFTNAFQEDLAARGITEETMSTKKVKLYLWTQSLISRFNPDGKKAKSKGNHIWNVDAKKLPNGSWVFREFKRKIIGQPPPYAVIDQAYKWEPKIWDPQASASSIKSEFSSPPGSLPSWLSWNGEKLVGTPNASSAGGEIKVLAKFVDGSGVKRSIEHTYIVQVVSFAVPEGVILEPHLQAYPQPAHQASHLIPGRRIASEPFLTSMATDNTINAQTQQTDFTFLPLQQSAQGQSDPRQQLGHAPPINLAFSSNGPPSFLQQ